LLYGEIYILHVESLKTAILALIVCRPTQWVRPRLYRKFRSARLSK